MIATKTKTKVKTAEARNVKSENFGIIENFLAAWLWLFPSLPNYVLCAQIYITQCKETMYFIFSHTWYLSYFTLTNLTIFTHQEKWKTPKKVKYAQGDKSQSTNCLSDWPFYPATTPLNSDSVQKMTNKSGFSKICIFLGWKALPTPQLKGYWATAPIAMVSRISPLGVAQWKI